MPRKDLLDEPLDDDYVDVDDDEFDDIEDSSAEEEFEEEEFEDEPEEEDEGEYEDDEYEDDEYEDEPEDSVERAWFNFGPRIHSLLSFLISMVLHATTLVVMAMLSLETKVKPVVAEVTAEVVPQDERLEEDLAEVMLEDNLRAATEMTFAAVGSSPGAVAHGVAMAGGSGTQRIDAKVVENFNVPGPGIGIDGPVGAMPIAKRLIEQVPLNVEFKGEARALVGDYQQALDQMTQEIMWMLDRSEVHLIWAFDQSESMKDDQKEIRDRVDKVYTELGLANYGGSDRLLTTVTSFGQGFAVHTAKPTSELNRIRQAIDSIPVDVSGKEMLTQSVGRALFVHRSFNFKNRQPMLVIVTDESGDRETNERFLEQAIAEAKALQCRIYVLGREAVFGYHTAQMRWVHPQTKHTHWLPIDRGPETAFAEQLQTDGFTRRSDAFPSGFGPYEQSRLCRETGGIFFLLPSLETSLVRGEKHQFDLNQLAAYRPDLRARFEVLTDRDKQPLRKLLWDIIYDLNPYNKTSNQIIELRQSFSREPATFVQQMNQEITKAKLFIGYLALAQKKLEQARTLREREAQPRWQANYDLIYAQTIAYQARIYEFEALLEDFKRNPRSVPFTKPPNLSLTGWHLTHQGKPNTKEAVPYIQKSMELFEKVKKLHPGTPWASRAEGELKRGFGVDLVPHYHAPAAPSPPVAPGVTLMPVPSL